MNRMPLLSLFRMKGLLIAVSLSVILGGCPPVTLKTVTLSPSLDQASEFSFSQNAVCTGIPPWGSGPALALPGEIYVGFVDLYLRGPDPVPCEMEQVNLYRGHVAFDLSQFDVVGGATLLFGLDSSGHAFAPDGSVMNPDNPAQSYATTVGTSTGTKDNGQGPYYWDFDNPLPLPSCTTMMFEPCSLDVTAQVKAWVDHTHINFGFIVAGPVMDFPDNLPHDNNANISWYRGFQLQVLYNPAANPRAPQ